MVCGEAISLLEAVGYSGLLVTFTVYLHIKADEAAAKKAMAQRVAEGGEDRPLVMAPSPSPLPPACARLAAAAGLGAPSAA